MKRTYVKLKWTGMDKGRSVNGRPLREGEVFDVPASDAEYMLTLPNVEAVGGSAPVIEAVGESLAREEE